MSVYRLGHLSDRELLTGLNTLVARDRATTAELLAHLAEVDERKLYLPAGYPSMFAYCVGQLEFSDDATYRRITVARAARQFPVLYTAVADGRLHLTAASMLAPHLTSDSAAELVAAAAHKSKAELEWLLAERFPRQDLPTQVRVVTPDPHRSELVPERVAACDGHAPERVAGRDRLAPERVETHDQLVPERVEAARQPAPARVEAQAPRPKVTPLAPGRVALQVTVSHETHDKLRHAQALLGHRVPSGDLAQVLDLALDALVAKLEEQKFAATDRPRGGSPRDSRNARHIPAAVKRAVWERDQGQCAFVAENGLRCGSRTDIEYDHVDPVACGGEASVDTIRLLCRAHNQYMAERTFGAGFMDEKRAEARRARMATRVRTRPSDDTDAVPRLRYRADETRRAGPAAAG